MTGPVISVIRADITTLDVDAIVNAANERMLGGGGVDGAVHSAAGPRLYEACKSIPEVRPGVRCPTGEVRITPGFDLQARHIIHTVGPVWDEHTESESRSLLARCYKGSLDLASKHALSTIAFPCIGAGVYGVPIEVSADVAFEIVRRHAGATGLHTVTLCCFSSEDLKVYQRREVQG